MTIQLSSSISEKAEKPTLKDGKEIVTADQVNELFFCVVGHIGSGTSKIALALKEILSASDFESEIIKASDLISNKANIAKNINKHERVKRLQNEGDKLRKKDYGYIARLFILQVRKLRAQKTSQNFQKDKPTLPDDGRRAYILDSVKHPYEIEILKKVYKNSFITIGVVCDEQVRKLRISEKFDIGASEINLLMSRDAKDSSNKHGQRVSDAFHLSDFYVNNTVNEKINRNEGNTNWVINDHLLRLVEIITHKRIIRPTLSETAMYHAHGAKLKSSCMSRQVGASIVDKKGNVISTGINEVPKAGGGTYGDNFEGTPHIDGDFRCFRKVHFIPNTDLPSTPYCSNDREKALIANEIADELIDILELNATKNRKKLLALLRSNSRISNLLEFSRAVHAEMDAILSAQRQGKSIVGAKLFVTTFPCHYCARHIITAGIDEVQYIEPYPKSLAYKLHSDSMDFRLSNEGQLPSEGGSLVLFKPFVGVSPSLYPLAFLKERELKDKNGIHQIQPSEWGTNLANNVKSMSDLECALTFEL